MSGITIEKALKWDSALDDLLHESCNANPYILIDAETYGLTGESVNTLLVKEFGKLVSIIYRYHNTIQLAAISSLSEEALACIAREILRIEPSMVSAEASLIQRLEPLMSGYEVSYGYTMVADGSQTPCADVAKASIDDMRGIAELVCSNQEIGSHYTVESLESQLLERIRVQGCRSFIMKIDDSIIAHMSTYGESSELAVLGGLISKPGSEKGNGSKVLSTLAADVLADGKVPILYCYVNALWPWYEQRGWRRLACVGKLERV